MTTEHFDVLIIGAGLSGIGMGCHLAMRCPGKSYTVLEARDTIGGTWDLFRYPGIRSDSDMHTLGYSFRPWEGAKAIADGPSILQYVRDTAAAYGVDKRIRFNHAAKRMSWSSSDALWTVEAEQGPDRAPVRFTCKFLVSCSGYYDYSGGYTPEFPGVADYRGRLVHPQQWPDDLDCAGKQVVVIGSGATAVTLVPALAGTAAHVTMLQRSPTYIVARPAEDAFANKLRQRLPPKLAYGITRWRNVLLTMFFYNMARKKPEKFKGQVMKGVRAHLGPDYDVATHFTPRYNPWDQRLCLSPDSDFFMAVRKGSASVVTDTIESFTADGLRLASGKELAADVVITATGLRMVFLGGMEMVVDGKRVEPSSTMGYKGMMFSGIPNMAAVLGYTNASWTLKADLTSEYVCRLLRYMDRRGMQSCVPTRGMEAGSVEAEGAPFLNLKSGYVERASALLPRQGTTAPWKLHQNYARDLVTLRYGRVDDGTLVFTRKVRERVPA